jgi:hypothetical protein
MPEPTRSQGDWNPPAGDAAFDSLFQELDTPPTAPASTTPQAPVEQQPTPQTTQTEPQAPSFELRTPSGTVYKSADEVIRGIESKDAAINQLRNTVIAMTGYDPLTKRPTQQFEQVSYLASPDRYAKDLSEAAEEGTRTGSYDKFTRVHTKLIGEVIQSQIAPYVPNVLQAGRQNAVNTLAQAVPDFPTFYGSAEYEQTLEASPALRKAIATAEQTPDFQAELPELYKLAYEVRQATKLREQIKSGNAAPPNQTAPRPTLTSTTLTPPAPTAPQARPTLSSSEGRKAIIADAERKGVLDTVF